MNVRSYAPVVGAFGLITMIFGLLMGFPLAVSFLLGDGATTAYDESLLITFGVGLALWFSARHSRRDLRTRDGFLLVSATWLFMPVFAMLPLILYQPELSITVKERFGDSMADLDIVWDVNLDGVSGGYHFPRDYEAHAKFHLVDGIKIFAHRLKAEILRFPAAENDVDGATDLVAWDDAYRGRSYAAFKARMDALDAQAA